MSQSFNYRHLFYFWVVAKEGGIARAAERLDMAVQTISAQVRELEKALGVSLLRTEGRNLVLTDAGVAALHEADHIFALGELLPVRVREAASGQTLRLNLGISDGIAKLAVHRLLTPVLDEPHLRLLCVVKNRPLTTVGAGSVTHQLIELAAADNIGATTGKPYAEISMDEVMKQNPDVLLFAVGLSEERSESEQQPWQRCESLGAVRTGRLYSIDHALITRPGPRIAEALEQLVSLLHPDIFPGAPTSDSPVA